MSLMDAKDKRIAELEGIIKNLLEEIKQLKAEIAILKKNSQNSSVSVHDLLYEFWWGCPVA